MSVKEASDRLGRELERVRRTGHGCVPEADVGVNSASRSIITAMAEEHGEVWLALVNPRAGESSVWKWDGNMVYNFGADMAFPKDDEELRSLLVAFRERPSVLAVAAVHTRLDEIGGKLLLWG